MGNQLLKKMDKRSISLLLVLASAIFARPQQSKDENVAEAEDYDYYDDLYPCSSYFKDAPDIFTEVGINKQKRVQHLTFDCINKILCKDGLTHNSSFNDLEAGNVLKSFQNGAKNAKCPDDDDVCCKVKYSDASN